MALRDTTHAGSWYSDNARILGDELDGFLDLVEDTIEPYPIKRCKAIIAPHAGYSYSGPAAAWAYKSIDITGIKRVFILGPSHHYHLDGCALSKCREYPTPIGTLPLDMGTVQLLRATRQFQLMSVPADEAEHSLEMQLPFVRKIFSGRDIKIVPILVGAISKEQEEQFGAILAPYLASDDTMFIISSDFCHWGVRFSYTYYYPEAAAVAGSSLSRTATATPSPDYPIYDSISRLDHEAMDALTMSPSTAAEAHQNFAKYLMRTHNTICGRHPIGVLLGALATLEKEKEIKPELKWVRYEQSSPCHSIRDSSVSYASAFIRF